MSLDCLTAIVPWLQPPSTPHSRHRAYDVSLLLSGSVACAATVGSSTLVFILRLRNFGLSSAAVVMIGSGRWHTPGTSKILSKCWASVISTVCCTFWIVETCLCLQARPRFAQESVVALVPSTAGLAALGLLHSRRVCFLSSCSLDSAHQSARSLLALSESALG